ncbi:hypothetical protein K474DRAFT_1687780 [Panus rudis PR-1116 ss-1]|nr:hypothetical protein K474DRAFT_1687780 [Panus rudis PR-1116 ss-1]
MSALTLKSLTSANTKRNQEYIVELQTEVIRMQGKRPDSPTTKVKTALEKQKEERILQRQQRAERRARKTAVMDESNDNIEVEPSGDISVADIEPDSNGDPERHVRGPGEDEDYVTPPRPERPSKKARFGSEGEGETERQEKRVKWNRGLATTVYIDNTPPKPTKPPKEDNVSRKGCLANTAKAIRLDTMGNALNAAIPVSGLTREQIIVKKFVYDDDIEAQPPTPAKSTRSKSKKAKS